MPSDGPIVYGRRGLTRAPDVPPAGSRGCVPERASGSCVVVGQGVRFAEAAVSAGSASGTARPRIGVETKALAGSTVKGLSAGPTIPVVKERVVRAGASRALVLDTPDLRPSPALRRSDFTSPTALASVQVQTHEPEVTRPSGRLLWQVDSQALRRARPGRRHVDIRICVGELFHSSDRQPARVRVPARRRRHASCGETRTRSDGCATQRVCTRDRPLDTPGWRFVRRHLIEDG